MTLDIHILGRNFRGRLRGADIPAGQVCISVDTVVGAVLYIPLLLIHELPAVLRAGVAGSRGRDSGGDRH